jgi:predicted membrane protein
LIAGFLNFFPFSLFKNMMKNFFLRFTVFFLLFSVAAETFSAVFITSGEQVSFAEKEETDKDGQKEKKETASDEFKDKFFNIAESSAISTNVNSLWRTYLRTVPLLRQAAPPEMPPEAV